jgi:hypothetical protein
MVSYIKGGMQTKGSLKTGSWGEYLGPKRMGSGEGDSEELRGLYRSLSIVRVTKSRRGGQYYNGP